MFSCENLLDPLDDPDMVWFLETGRPRRMVVRWGFLCDCTDVTTAERISGVGMQCGSTS